MPKNTKKVLLIFILMIMILLIFTGWGYKKIYESKKYEFPRWEGVSKNSEWKAIIAKDKETKSQNFFGKLAWVGSKEDFKKLQLNSVKLYADGKYFSGDTKETTYKTDQRIIDTNSMAFLEWGEYKNINDKELFVHLNWSQNGEKYSTKIKLRKISNN